MGAILFVTATGTEVGKTYVTASLLRELRASGRSCAAVKPVMSGYTDDEAAESDAGRLLAAMGRAPTPEAVAEISPWRFVEPLSPDMAAAREGRGIDFEALLRFCREEAQTTELLLVEGVGGAMVPLTAERTVMDWMAALGAPALVVAGSYLGTISHSLTTLEAMRTRGVTVAGLVISESLESPVPVEETAEVLGRFTDVPIRIVRRGATKANLAPLAQPRGERGRG
jgi:dethiobiotin synthetase